MCSDKDTFSKVAASLGVYIPVQDATWEQEEGFYGFQEQGQLYSTCDASKCLCPKGRKHTLNGTYFELIRCEQCGSSAVHIKCGNLLKKAPFYVCKDHEKAKEQMDRPGFIFGRFFRWFFSTLLHASTMSQTIPDIHGSSQIFPVLEGMSF